MTKEEKIERLVSFAIGLTIGTLLWCSWQDMGLNERMQKCEQRLTAILSTATNSLNTRLINALTNAAEMEAK